jgi:hypothetical protein
MSIPLPEMDTHVARPRCAASSATLMVPPPFASALEEEDEEEDEDEEEEDEGGIAAERRAVRHMDPSSATEATTSAPASRRATAIEVTGRAWWRGNRCVAGSIALDAS